MLSRQARQMGFFDRGHRPTRNVFQNLRSETSEQRAPEEQPSSLQRPNWMERIGTDCIPIDFNLRKAATPTNGQELCPKVQRPSTLKAATYKSKTSEERPTSQQRPKCMSPMSLYYCNRQVWIPTISPWGEGGAGCGRSMLWMALCC